MPNRLRHLCTAVVILFWALGRLSAAEFFNVNALFGTSVRQAWSVCEDRDGFIWASATTGVMRLGGDDCRMYRLPGEPEWGNILNIRLDYHASRLVAYTDNGLLFLYDLAGDDFGLELNLGRALNNAYLAVHRVLVDERGFWIASSAGLFRYEGGQVARVTGLGGECFDIARHGTHRLIVADSEGIRLCDTRTHRIEKLYDNGTSVPFRTTALFFDPALARLWIGTRADGLYTLDTESRVLSRVQAASLPAYPMYAIAGSADSTVLVGIDGQGIWELSADGSRVVDVHKENADDPASLPGNGVQALFRDSKDRVWVCTYSGGVSFFEGRGPSAAVRQFSHRAGDPRSLANNSVSSLLEDRRGRLWFATDNGISRYDPAGEEWRHFYTRRSEYSQSFTSLCEDDRGRIWAGSLSSGLYILDADTGRELAHYDRDSPRPANFDFVYSIHNDGEGGVWVSDSRQGLVRWHTAEDRFVSNSRESVGAFARLPDGKMVLGGTSSLSLLDRQTGHRTSVLSGFLIKDLLAVGDRIWICTGGQGLLRYDYQTGSIAERYTVADGLPSDHLNSIAEVDGILWIGTENGICRIDPATGAVHTFSSVGAFADQSYNRRASFRLSSGELAWGTGKGVVIFAPDALQSVQRSGKIFFQDLYLAGRSIRQGGEFDLPAPIDSLTSLRLPRSTRGFSLELLPLDAPRNAALVWRLEGFDGDWPAATGNRTVTYTSLPAGKFTLAIRLMDGPNVLAERRLAVRVRRPVPIGGWVALLATLAAGVWLTARIRRKRAAGVPHREPADPGTAPRSKAWQTIRTVVQQRETELQKQRIEERVADRDAARALNDQFLKRAAGAIIGHMADPSFGKEDFALAMHVSTSLLYKRLKVLTGLSPSDFIRTIRLDHARELLRSGNYSVTEVSELCGFSSVGYFSTVFRKHFGGPPSDFIARP